MNICIDAFGMTSLKGTGHYTYTKNLIEGLMKSYPQPAYSLLWEGEGIEAWKKANRVSFIDLNIKRKNEDSYKLEQYLTNKQIRIFHSPNNGFSIPKGRSCTNIMTVHDLIAKTNPQLVDDEYRAKFNHVFEEAVKSADRIIAVSMFIKKELEYNFKVDPEKVSVVYPWYNPGYIPEASVSREMLRCRYNISDEFILSIGSLHPRKNLKSLIRAYKASDLYKEGIKLVIAGMTNGKRQYHYQMLKELTVTLGLCDHVIFTGLIEHEDAKHFYNCARCIVNISEYEGFPQVCMEAMTMEAPIICARNSSFMETVGAEGNYVDPKDLSEVRASLKAVALSSTDAKVPRLTGQKLKFTEEESIKKIVSLYENVIC